MDDITPAHIEAAALDARVPMIAVLKRSGVASGAFYKWRSGECEMRPLTKARLVDAIKDLKAERVHSKEGTTP